MSSGWIPDREKMKIVSPIKPLETDILCNQHPSKCTVFTIYALYKTESENWLIANEILQLQNATITFIHY